MQSSSEPIENNVLGLSFLFPNHKIVIIQCINNEYDNLENGNKFSVNKEKGKTKTTKRNKNFFFCIFVLFQRVTIWNLFLWLCVVVDDMLSLGRLKLFCWFNLEIS